MKKLFHNIKGATLMKIAALLVVVGGSAVNLCMYPFWHYEPEMPASLKAKL